MISPIRYRIHASITHIAVCMILLVPVVTAAPPETRRVIHEIVRQDEAPAVAIEIDYTYYTDPPEIGMPDEEIRAWCASLPPGERYAAPECLALDDFVALKMADSDSRATLYAPGAARKSCLRWFERFGIDTEAYRLGMEHATVRFLAKWRNGDLVRILYRIDNSAGPHHSTSGSLLMRFDPESGAYSAVSFNDYTAHNEVEYASLVIIENLIPEQSGFRRISTPRGLSTWKHVQSGVIAAAQPEIDEYRQNSRLFLGLKPLPHIETPFVLIPTDDLDKDDQRLQQQMLTLLLAEDGVISFEQGLEVWHPDAHNTLRKQLEERQRDPDKWKGYAFFTYGGGSPAKDTTLIRIVARVRWDDGVVWYGWAPRRQNRLPEVMVRMLEDQQNLEIHAERINHLRDHIVTIRQRRGPDGEYRFATQFMPGAEPAHSLTMRILSDPALAETIVREHRRDAHIADDPELDP